MSENTHQQNLRHSHSFSLLSLILAITIWRNISFSDEHPSHSDKPWLSFLLLAQRYSDLLFSSKNGVSYCLPWQPVSGDLTYLCSTVACLLDPHLDSSQLQGKTKPKGGSVASGDFVLCPLASFPATDWTLKLLLRRQSSFYKQYGMT